MALPTSGAASYGFASVRAERLTLEDCALCGREARSRVLDYGSSAENEGPKATILSPPAAARLVVSPLLTLVAAKDREEAGVLKVLSRASASLVEEPTTCPEPRLFDTEGTPCRRVALIEEGRLVGSLLTRLEADAKHARPTGSAWRASFRAAPAASPRDVSLGLKQSFDRRHVNGIEIVDVREHDFNPANAVVRSLVVAQRVRGGGREGDPFLRAFEYLLETLLERIQAVGRPASSAERQGALWSPELLIEG